jgi:hypothetical protein
VVHIGTGFCTALPVRQAVASSVCEEQSFAKKWFQRPLPEISCWLIWSFSPLSVMNRRNPSIERTHHAKLSVAAFLV